MILARVLMTVSNCAPNAATASASTTVYQERIAQDIVAGSRNKSHTTENTKKHSQLMQQRLLAVGCLTAPLLQHVRRIPKGATLGAQTVNSSPTRSSVIGRSVVGARAAKSRDPRVPDGKSLFPMA